MRTTLDLPEELLSKAMKLSKAKTKTGAITLALEELVRKMQIKDLRDFKGKIDLDMDLNSLRNRK